MYWTQIEPIADQISIYDGPKTFLRQFGRAPVIGRNLLAAHWCQSEVCNGGFKQFFWNSTGVLAPEAVAAFEALKMPRTADVVARAAAWFGPEYARERDTRIERLDAYAEAHPNQPDPFADLNDEFYALIDTENGGFETAADAYAEGG